MSENNQEEPQTLCIKGVHIPEEWFIEIPEIVDYIYDMSTIQITALKIAMEHLKTSFDFARSNGFVEWSSNRSSKS